MWAFVSNEWQGIIYSRNTLQLYRDLYTAVSYTKIADEDEGNKFIRNKQRKFIFGYGTDTRWLKTQSYLRVEYFVLDGQILVNIYTDKFGYIALAETRNNVVQSVSYDCIRVKIFNVNLRQNSIQDNCLAALSILNLFNPMINVLLIAPDLSVYLALTCYKGYNKVICNTASRMKSREGKLVIQLNGKNKSR